MLSRSSARPYRVLLAALIIAAQDRTAKPDFILEDVLRPSLAHVKFGSPEFLRRVRAGVDKCHGQIRWQPAYGPSPVRVGVVDSQDVKEFWGRQATVVFWPTPTGSTAQVLDEVLSEREDERGYAFGGEAFRSGSRLTVAGWATNGGNWSWSSIRAYRLGSKGWTLIRAVPESGEMEDFPGTHFLRRSGKVDPSTVVETVQVYPDHLDQPHAGPKLKFEQIVKIRGDHFLLGPRHQVPNALGELDRLAALAQANKRSRFDAAVPKPYRARLWKLLQHPITVFCNKETQDNDCATLSLWYDGVHSRGSVDLKFHFAKVGTSYRLKRVD